MIDCCMLSIYKIYKVKTELDRDEISSFIYSNFSDDTDITNKRLFTWCSKCTEIQSFFKVLKKELSQPINSIKNPRLNLKASETVGH